MSAASGILNAEGKGLGVVAADFDDDGWTDLYVANDTVRNFHYRNNRQGGFEDMTLLSGTGYNEEPILRREWAPMQPTTTGTV